MLTTPQSHAAHTPGPWHDHEHYTDNKHDGHIIAGSDGHGITRTWHDRFDNSRRSAEKVDANVRLIAAAPELLAALEQAAAGLATCANHETDPSSKAAISEWFHNARAAIAKATGAP